MLMDEISFRFEAHDDDDDNDGDDVGVGVDVGVCHDAIRLIIQTFFQKL